MSPGITVVTHTMNSASTLPELLDSTQWADARLIIDMQSDDDTVAVAEQAGCRVISADRVPAVDSIRNKYLSEVDTEWTLVLDSDEFLAADAGTSITDVIAHHGNVADAFAIPRYNYIAGQILQGSQWYPDHQIRLFRTGTVSWQDGHHRIPEVVTGQDRLHTLNGKQQLHIHHRNYPDICSLIERQLRYALTDSYDDDREGFDFNQYVTTAYAEYSRRFDPNNDGELSVALATIMAWDQVMRGLIHWDRLGRPPGLENAFSLPLRTEIASEADKAKPTKPTGKKSGMFRSLLGARSRDT